MRRATRLVSGSAPSRRAISSASTSDSSSSSSDSISARSYVQPTSPKASAAATPVALAHRRERAATTAASSSTSIPATAAHAADPARAPAGTAPRAVRTRRRARRTARSASARRSSAPTRSPARGPGRSAAARRSGRPGPRGRPAARRRPDRPGARRARPAPSSRAAGSTVMPSLDLVPRDALGLVPLAGSQAQPGDHRRRVRGEGVHLVLLGVGERLLSRSAAPPPARAQQHQRVGEVVRAHASPRAGRRRRRRWRAPRAACRSPSRSSCSLGGADVDERVGARALVAEPGRELERPVAPQNACSGSSASIAELRQPAVGAGQLDRLAERLEDRDRLARLDPRCVAVAREPVEPRQRPACSGRPPPRRRDRRRSRSPARSRRTRRRAGRRRTRPSPAPRGPSPRSAGG